MTNQIPVFRLYPGEVGYLGLLILVSGYMWYGSYEYDSLAGFFPRLMSVIVLLMSGTLLLRRTPVFPERLRNVIESDSGSFGDVEDSFGDKGDDEEADRQLGASRKSVFLGILTGLYMVVGFLFGLLWGTPFYVMAYLRYTNQSWTLTIAITAIVTVLVYVMMAVFNITLETGWALRTLGVEVPLTIVADSVFGPTFGGVN